MFAFDPQLRASIVAHMVKAVTETPLETDPFPHISIRGFLPPRVYSRLMEQLPDVALFEPFDYEKHQTGGESNRRRFQMSNAWLDKLAGETRTLWYTLRSALGSRELKAVVFSKLSPGLAFRYGVAPNEAVSLPGYALPELFHETDGYRIKPHPDTRKKVVTMQFALATDASQEPLGTEFYRRSRNPASWFREPRGFEIAKRMPFAPNAAYAFVVLNTLQLKSWHGRTSIPGEAGSRMSLLNIWYEKLEHANGDLAAEAEACDAVDLSPLAA
jgi:hypothetical protein